MHTAAEVFLRYGPVIAHELAAVDHLEDARRHVEQRMAVRMAGLEQQHSSPGLDQARGRHAARRAAAHHDMIETRLHRAFMGIDSFSGMDMFVQAGKQNLERSAPNVARIVMHIIHGLFHANIDSCGDRRCRKKTNPCVSNRKSRN